MAYLKVNIATFNLARGTSRSKNVEAIKAEIRAGINNIRHVFIENLIHIKYPITASYRPDVSFADMLVVFLDPSLKGRQFYNQNGLQNLIEDWMMATRGADETFLVFISAAEYRKKKSDYNYQDLCDEWDEKLDRLYRLYKSSANFIWIDLNDDEPEADEVRFRLQNMISGGFDFMDEWASLTLASLGAQS